MASLPFNLDTLLFGVGRSIAGIVPDVVISESHTDEVVVTEHPVDSGSNVADHAYIKPAQIEATFGWSDSSRLINSSLSGSIFKGLAKAKDVYKKLLELQYKRQPFRLKTGKRTYSSVIITKLETTTDSDTENSLVITATFTEVRIAKTTLVSLASVKSKSKHGAVNRLGSRYAMRTDPGLNFKGVK